MHNALITPDKEFLFSSDSHNIEVWNLKSRIKQKSFDFIVEWQTLNCSFDSKFVFFNYENNILMQYNLIEMKEEHKYIMIGTIAHSAIDSKDQFLYIVTWLGEFQIFSLESKKMIGELP